MSEDAYEYDDDSDDGLDDESDDDLVTGHDEQAQDEDETSDMRIGSYLKNRYGK